MCKESSNALAQRRYTGSESLILLDHEQNYAITSIQRNVLHLTIHLVVCCNILNSNYPDYNDKSFSHDCLNSFVGMYSIEMWSCNSSM
jgi:hypothetical protein